MTEDKDFWKGMELLLSAKNRNKEDIWRYMEDLLLTRDKNRIYSVIKSFNRMYHLVDAVKYQLDFVDNIHKLKIIVKALSSENRFEIFNFPAIQACLDSISLEAKKFIMLYDIFMPEDALKFLKSQSVQEKLSKISLSDEDRYEILIYFKDKLPADQEFVKGLLKKVDENNMPNKIEVNNKNNEETKKEKNISLLNVLQQTPPKTQLNKLGGLIKEKNYDELLFPQLKAIVALIPKQDRFAALKLIEENSNIQFPRQKIDELKIYLPAEGKDQLSNKKLLASYSELNFKQVLTIINGCPSNKRLQQIQALNKQYKLNFSSCKDIKIFKTFVFSFHKKDFFDLLSITPVRDKIKEINKKDGLFPSIPVNQAEALELLNILEQYNSNTASESKAGVKKQLSHIGFRNEKQQQASAAFFKKPARNRTPDIISGHNKVSFRKH